MKKRFLSLALILVLTVCVFAVGVSANETAETVKQQWSHLTISEDGTTAVGYCPHCCDDPSQTVDWKLYTRTPSHNNLTTSGHYFLNESTRANGALQPSTPDLDFVLHLNSKTYERWGDSSNNTGAIRPQAENTTFSIVDDKEQVGAIDGDFGWAVYSNGKAGTKIVLHSGNLTSRVTEIATSGTNTNGGTIRMNSGTFEMYGGTVNGTKAVYGGAICASGETTVHIEGGTITGGQATSRGGNIYMASLNCKLTIAGGTIADGICLDNGTNACGGGNIYANNGLFTLSGGTVSGGKAVRGGNIFASTGSDENDNNTVINGTAVIKDGEATYGGNLYINNKLTLGAGTLENGKGAYGSDIYVATSANLTVDAAYNGEAGIYYTLNHLPDTVPGGVIAPYKNRAADSEVPINRCTGVFTGKLYVENEVGCPSIYAKQNDDKLHISSVALIDNNGKYTWFTNNADAVAAYGKDTAYMQVIDGALTLSGGDYVVDLAGSDVQLKGTGNVTMFDSANDDYATYGTATVNGPVVKNDFQTTVAGKDTYMVNENGVYSFHRIGVQIIGVSVRPSAAGMYYTGIWQCDDLLAKKVETFGVAVSVVNKPGKNFATDNDTLYTVFGKNEFASGIPQNGVLIGDIVTGNTSKNIARSRRNVYAAAYIAFEDGSVAVSGEEVAHSLYGALRLAEGNLYNYVNDAENLKNFADTWNKAGASWKLDFDLSEDEKKILAVYGGTAAYHGEAHDHAATGGKSDGNFTLNQWKKGMDSLDMDFATIVDHRQSSHMELSDWDDTLFIGGSEASTLVQGDGYEDGKNKMHYSMIFTDPDALEYVVTKTIVEYKIGPFTNYYNIFNYPPLSVSDVQTLIQAVKDKGGMFVQVHPKSDGYIQSDDPLMYWFADWTGLEVFYGYGGYAPEQAVNQDNYTLWTDLLAAGKKIWATAGSDQHAAPNTAALTTIYAEKADATTIFSHMKVGDSTCGPVGIRMCVGDTVMGSETDFAGKRLVFCVDDFHEVAYDPDHTYHVELISDTGVVYSAAFDASQPFCYGMDADDSAKFYRVEVIDDTAGYRIAIGNPIWNK